MNSEQVAAFERDGIVVVPGFADQASTDALMAQAHQLCTTFTDHHRSVFSTVNQKTDEYFMESGDKIRYFWEDGAFNEAGELTVPVERAINKIGHALHELDPVFRTFTRQLCIQAVAKALGLKDPLLAQSMYIFKQPGIGGEVVPHQDSTFLCTEPTTTLGFWIPLQDCTESNGCLWAIPGSHRHGLSRRLVRTAPGEFATTFTAPAPSYAWSDFVPLETKRGDLVLIHGEVVHASQANTSAISRHAYTFHVIESSPTAAYDSLNWLQPTPTGPFPRLFD